MLFSELWRLFLRVLDFWKFSWLFVHVLRYHFETWHIDLVTKVVSMLSSSCIPIWTLWLTLQPNIGQCHLSAFMALKVILRPQIWYTHSNNECLDPYWFSSCLGNFWLSGGQNHLRKGVDRDPASEKFYRLFFYMFRDMSFKPGIYIQQVARHMRFEFHHNQVSASGEFSGLFSTPLSLANKIIVDVCKNNWNAVR